MSRRVRFLVPLLVLAGLTLLAPSSYAECNTYQNSHVIHYNGQGYCGSSGGWCRECSEGWGGYGGGSSSCVSDSFGDSVCYDYQAMDWP